jgi:nucleoside phosphorylase
MAIKTTAQQNAKLIAMDPVPARHGAVAPKKLSQKSKTELPPLPVIDWKAFGGKMPVWQAVKNFKNGSPLPKADIVIITWTSAEWAAFDHVFCDSQSEMTYYEKNTWSQRWNLYNRGYSKLLAPADKSKNFTARSPSLVHKSWGSFCMVKLGNGKSAILFKSDLHVSTDGVNIPLIQMMQNILADTKAKLVLTIGTAGGARPQDCLGSVSIADGGHFLLSGEYKAKTFNNKTYDSKWKPKTTLLAKIKNRLMTAPVHMDHLQELAKKIKGGYSLNKLINDEITPGKIRPKSNPLRIPVLTTNAFVIGTTDGKYKQYAAMEMDDAVVGMVCDQHKTAFGVVRNISDPVQNATLPFAAQKAWGGAIYAAYGLYTSYNGALCAWAIASV